MKLQQLITLHELTANRMSYLDSMDEVTTGYPMLEISRQDEMAELQDLLSTLSDSISELDGEIATPIKEGECIGYLIDLS